MSDLIAGLFGLVLILIGLVVGVYFAIGILLLPLAIMRLAFP